MPNSNPAGLFRVWRSGQQDNFRLKSLDSINHIDHLCLWHASFCFNESYALAVAVQVPLVGRPLRTIHPQVVTDITDIP